MCTFGDRTIVNFRILSFHSCAFQTDAGKKKCKFNGNKFNIGEEVLDLAGHCCSLMCSSDGGKGRKPSAILTFQFASLTSCTCQSTSRSVLNLNDVLNARQLKLWGSEGNLKPKPQPERRANHGSNSNGAKKSVSARARTPAPAPPPAPSPTRECKDYADSFTPSHSICQPKNKACGIHREGVSEEEKKLILKEHNEYRAKVARGDESEGSPGPQPSAANMVELVWNQELADVAQAWCNTCPSTHDCNDCRRVFSIDGFVGQNLYWHFAFQSDQVWSQALKAFYDEVKFVPKILVDKYLTVPTAGPIGHYTQMVWAETREMGCGAAYHGPCAGSFPECKTYCCNYGPAGNILTRPIYEQGPAASNCPNGKSGNYDGLCKP
ncbi:CRISP/Allergen/PR-1-like [Penaeus monodon]|uniref:CRISP/Allergen/PR-1-like n=1 Tax=Penaeus monodon TaxID=6687 RepID=UPI0018A7A914|nr:CRISP/Allergen/PR-1-like [Penaeus monodon]